MGLSGQEVIKENGHTMSSNENEEQEKPVSKLMVLIVTGVLAGTGGNIGLRIIDPPRPDPFTGTEARQLEDRLNLRCQRIEQQLRDHNKEAEKWKLMIQHNQQAIEYYLNKLP